MYQFETRTATTNFLCHVLEWEAAETFYSFMHKIALWSLEDTYCAYDGKETIIGKLSKNGKPIAQYEYFGNGNYIVYRYGVPTKNAYTYIHRGFNRHVKT